MTLPGVSEIISMIGIVLAGSSIIVGVIVHTINIHWMCMKNTLEFWECIEQKLKEPKRELMAKYKEGLTFEQANQIYDNKEERLKVNRVLDLYERLALGVNLKIYDLKTINRLTGENVINCYQKVFNYINLCRINEDRSQIWIEFEILVAKLKKQ